MQFGSGLANRLQAPSWGRVTRRRRVVTMLAGLGLIGCVVVVATDVASRGKGIEPAPQQASYPVPALASEVYASEVGGMIEVTGSELDRVLSRLRATKGMSASELFHAIHLFGGDVLTPPGSLAGDRRRVLDVLLDVPAAAQLFDGAQTLATTRYGVRSPLNDPGLLGTQQGGAQAHRGQLLAVLAAQGVPGDRPIRLGDGTPRVVKAIRDDLAANFSMEGEIAWDAVALAFYHDGRGWTNKFGHRFTFDQVADELARRNPALESCSGTHALISLTTLVKVDGRKPILSPEARSRAILTLARQVERARASQREDGGWEIDWYMPGPRRPSEGKASSPEDRLLATGHLVEWLMLLPEPLRPGVEVLEPGARWLKSALAAMPDDPAWVDKNYCPIVHAARSLKLLAKDAGAVAAIEARSSLGRSSFPQVPSQEIDDEDAPAHSAPARSALRRDLDGP